MTFATDKPCAVITSRGTKVFGTVRSLDADTEEKLGVQHTDMISIGNKGFFTSLAGCEIRSWETECPKYFENLE